MLLRSGQHEKRSAPGPARKRGREGAAARRAPRWYGLGSRTNRSTPGHCSVRGPGGRSGAGRDGDGEHHVRIVARQRAHGGHHELREDELGKPPCHRTAPLGAAALAQAQPPEEVGVECAGALGDDGPAGLREQSSEGRRRVRGRVTGRVVARPVPPPGAPRARGVVRHLDDEAGLGVREGPEVPERRAGIVVVLQVVPHGDEVDGGFSRSLRARAPTVGCRRGAEMRRIE